MSIYDLALNMGCSVQQIETHYSHVYSKQRRKQITQTIRKKIVAEPADNTDQFLDEAAKWYRDGSLSKEAFLEIAKISKS